MRLYDSHANLTRLPHGVAESYYANFGVEFKLAPYDEGHRRSFYFKDCFNLTVRELLMAKTRSQKQLEESSDSDDDDEYREEEVDKINSESGGDDSIDPGPVASVAEIRKAEWFMHVLTFC